MSTVKERRYYHEQRTYRVLNEASSEELCEVQRQITTILETRRNNAKKEAWQKVARAIKEYSTTFGSIEVEADNDTFYISSSENFTEEGRITIEFED